LIVAFWAGDFQDVNLVPEDIARRHGATEGTEKRERRISSRRARGGRRGL